MKLHDVPRRSWVMVKENSDGPPASHNFDAGEVIFFDHIDGMYSYCRHPNGNICHLVAWAEVDIVPPEVIDRLFPGNK